MMLQSFLIEKIRKKQRKVIMTEHLSRIRSQLLFNTNMHMKHAFRKTSLFKWYD